MRPKANSPGTCYIIARYPEEEGVERKFRVIRVPSEYDMSLSEIAKEVMASHRVMTATMQKDASFLEGAKILPIGTPAHLRTTPNEIEMDNLNRLPLYSEVEANRAYVQLAGGNL